MLIRSLFCHSASPDRGIRTMRAQILLGTGPLLRPIIRGIAKWIKHCGKGLWQVGVFSLVHFQISNGSASSCRRAFCFVGEPRKVPVFLVISSRAFAGEVSRRNMKPTEGELEGRSGSHRSWFAISSPGKENTPITRLRKRGGHQCWSQRKMTRDSERLTCGPRVLTFLLSFWVRTTVISEAGKDLSILVWGRDFASGTRRSVPPGVVPVSAFAR